MRGFPKHMNTKADYEYVMEHYPVEAKPHLTALVEGRNAWLPAKAAEIKLGEKGVESETQRVVELRDESGKAVIAQVQEELREDPNAVIFRLGFAVEDVEKALGKI